MSNIATTAKAPTAAQTARALTAVVKAFGEAKSVHVSRVKAIGALKAQGLSDRGIVAAVTLHTNGETPAGFDKSAVARYAAVARVIGYAGEDTGAWSADVDAAEVIAALMPLARNVGTLTAAADLARAAHTTQGALDEIAAHRASLAAEALAAATRAPERAPAIGTQGAAPEPEEEEETAPEGTTRKGAEALAGASALALIAELTRRVGARSFTADAVLSEAFDALAAAWEEATTTADALADA